MSYREESREAFEEVRETLGERQKEVYEVMRKHGSPLTNNEIARLLRWQINRVTPRVLELRKMGWVIQGPKQNCRVVKTPRKVNTWIAVKIKKQTEQLEMAM